MRLRACFKRVLHLPSVVGQRHDIVDIGEARHMDADTNLKSREILQVFLPRIQSIVL